MGPITEASANPFEVPCFVALKGRVVIQNILLQNASEHTTQKGYCTMVMVSSRARKES